MLALVLLLISATAFAAEVTREKRFHTFTWFDLYVYRNAGLITRHAPAALYSWQLRPGIKFTYTPFAALLFALGSMLTRSVLDWLMTAASLAALPLTAWLTFRALGWRGERRLAAALAAPAVLLWSEPVIRALQLGQIELLLMLLIVADLCQRDQHWWKGAGVGMAAGIKLVPLIFIPYLLLCGRTRQAVTATAAFAVTALLGFALLPKASTHWWLTGYFLHAGNVGDVPSMVNQSLLAVIDRQIGSVPRATPIWLPLAVIVAAAGLSAAAVLHRRGQPVAGWVTCAITGLLVSPISWDQHWVWIIPIVILLIDRAVRAHGRARWVWWTLVAVCTGLYGDWPAYWSGRRAFLAHFGLIGFQIGKHSGSEAFHLHGAELIGWNLFAAAGLIMLAVAVTAAVRQNPFKTPWRPADSRRQAGLK